MVITPTNELAHHSTLLMFYWIFCPQCDFELHVRSLGYGIVNFGQEVSCKCPKCKKMITKKIGLDLGVISEEDLKDLQSLEDIPDTKGN